MLGAFCVSVLPVLVAAQSSAASPPSAYAVPGVFPTSVYGAYYNDPTATTAEPQPIITDPVTVSLRSWCPRGVRADGLPQHEVYPYWLTNPETIPNVRPRSPCLDWIRMSDRCGTTA